MPSFIANGVGPHKANAANDAPSLCRHTSSASGSSLLGHTGRADRPSLGPALSYQYLNLEYLRDDLLWLVPLDIHRQSSDYSP